MKNWKTTVPGILVVLVQAAYAIPAAAPYIGAVTALLTALGLYHAKDADKVP
jgi:hypothetical protein